MRFKYLFSLILAASLGMSVSAPAGADGDPYLWLEEVEGRNALAWARGMNEVSEGYLKDHPLFEEIHQRNLEILTSDERIAYPSLMGGAVFNFWRDASHVRGIWRTTTLESFQLDSPDWDVILDIDALADEEGKNWVWAGSGCRYPDYDRCLVGLSIGGADAAVRREFDLESRQFVDDGFVLPESKSQIGWRDRDTVFLGPAFDDEQVTDSGYPRQVHIWHRGTPIDQAELVFEGERSDVAVFGMRLWDGDEHHDLIVRAPGFFTRHYHLYRNGETVRLDVPEDANLVGILDGQLLIDLKSDWDIGGVTLPQGALVATAIEALAAGEARFETLFEPGERTSVAAVATTRSTVLVNVLDNVISKLVRFTHDGEGWHRHELKVPDMGTVSVVTTDDRSDRFFYNYTGFLTPSTLFEADAVEDRHREVRAEPAWFEADGMEVTQHEVASADGEMIPYFVVKPRGFEADGANPTLLGAYGGFEVSRRPFYSGLIGSNWLEKGGVYVLANIRGGGEFGPRWHQAALRENRQRAFDDLIAVAEDLVRRGITSPEHLGIQGGSNGGLLVGAVFTQRPDLINAVVCQVPLLDMKRYHKLLAGASWMAEYGNPDDPDDWAFIREYSPYQNLASDADYPKVFFTTSTRDDRVHPGHARKMVAKMADMGHDVLYYENIEGGHGGAANLEQSAYINALIYAYLHDRLNPQAQGD